MQSCARTRCNITMACPPGSKYVQTAGECCGKCVENEGVCMAFGNSHYKTFDGKIYNFGGLGKYQFVSDCRSHIFSVRITNVHNKRSVNTRRITIKSNSIRINLAQNFKCKVNGDLVKFPFKIEGSVKIEKRLDVLEVTLSSKVVIVWNGKSFLEVTVPPEFKNKLCGLCGNFNSNVKDDFKLRRGVVVRDTDAISFASSWCVGPKSCIKQSAQLTPLRQCKIRNADRNHCKHLLSTKVFNGCDSKLNSNKYYNACKSDMCDCPNGKCYCESLMAYSRECGRLGVDVDNWKKDSFCININKARRKKPISNSMFSQEDISKILRVMNKQNRTKSGRSPIPLN
ncbi:BMP-binding endothelial regulator protein-like [Agrilus planipennis]|nr:BMP-binding endothelial regulator protein-like [Agrilus planipennis]